MKVAIYARVSKALEQNPENQLIELRKWAKNNDYEVFNEYVDEISSKDTRPQKEEVLKLLRRKDIDGVGFWSLDRWGRNMVELIMEMEEFKGSKQTLFSYQEALDLSTAAGRLAGNMLAALASFERDRIRERTMLGLARARNQGKKLGRPSKSGRKYKKPSTKEVIPYADKGLSLRAIASKLGTSKYWVEVVLKKIKADGMSVRVTE